MKKLLRTPEEIARDEERLREQHADILGDWVAEDSPEDEGPAQFVVEEGFLVIKGGGGPPSRLTEPDDKGVVRILGAPYVAFIPFAAESGEIERIEIRVGAELEDTLRRPKD